MYSDQNSYELVSISKLSIFAKDEGVNSQFPTYLLTNVFKNLSLYDLSNCMKVCKLWYYYANEDSLWTDIDFKNANKILNKNLMMKVVSKYKECFKRVSFHGCTNMTDEILKIFCVNKPNIYYLSLRYCYNITDMGIEYIEANLKNITYLDLLGCSNISWRGFKLISKMSQLKHLNISWCNLINYEISGVNFEHLKNLESFMADGYPQISNYSIDILLKNCTNLKKLSINNCPNIGYEAFKNLQKSSKLEYLNIGRSVRSYNRLLQIIKTRCPFLKYLILIECRFRYQNLISLVKNCKNLQYLDLEGTEVDDEFLFLLTKVAKNLRFLGLSYVLGVTDRGIRYLSRSELISASLEHIELDGLCYLSSHSINYLRDLRNLKILDIVDCPQFNSLSLKMLQECNKKLIIHANVFIKRRELAYAEAMKMQRSNKNITDFKNRLRKRCIIL